jgi:DNA-binding NarL/FixJ family response regulator
MESSPGTGALRVVVAEDQVLLREGIVRLLREHGIDVVAQAADATDLVRKVSAHHPDVAVTDVQMPPDHSDDGLRAAIRIRAEQPEVGVLVLSQFLDERYALDLIGDDPKGVGYLLKDRVGDVNSFVGAIRRVAAGGSALDPEVVARMVGRQRRDDPLAALSPREREVLALMAEGKSNAGIAESLHVTVAAVEKHSTRIFSKLDLGIEPSEHRRVMAVLRLLQAG